MAAAATGTLPASTSHASLVQAHQRAAAHPQVDYVLLAEFDIDQGSLVRHQYPAPTGTDEQSVPSPSLSLPRMPQKQDLT